MNSLVVEKAEIFRVRSDYLFNRDKGDKRDKSMDSKPSPGRSLAGAAIRVRVYEQDQSIPARQ